MFFLSDIYIRVVLSVSFHKEYILMKTFLPAKSFRFLTDLCQCAFGLRKQKINLAMNILLGCKALLIVLLNIPWLVTSTIILEFLLSQPPFNSKVFSLIKMSGRH